MSWDECFRSRAREIVLHVVRKQFGVRELRPIPLSLILPREIIPDFTAVGFTDSRTTIIICEFYSYGTPLSRRDIMKVSGAVALISYTNWTKVPPERILSLIISVREIPFIRELNPARIDDGVYAVKLAPYVSPTIIIEVERLRKFPLLLVFHPRRVLEALEYYLSRPEEPETRLVLTLISELMGNYSRDVVRAMVEKLRETRPAELPPEALELAKVILEKMSEIRPESTVKTITDVVRRRKELPPEALELAKVILEKMSEIRPEHAVEAVIDAVRRVPKFSPKVLKLVRVVLERTSETDRRAVIRFLKEMLEEMEESSESEVQSSSFRQ